MEVIFIHILWEQLQCIPDKHQDPLQISSALLLIRSLVGCNSNRVTSAAVAPVTLAAVLATKHNLYSLLTQYITYFLTNLTL